LSQQLAASKSEAGALKREKAELAEVVLEMQEELDQLKAAAAQVAAATQDAAAAATQQLRRELQEARAAAAAATELQQQRAAQLTARCTQLADQAAQLESALQQQVLAAQQTAASRQQQILVRLVSPHWCSSQHCRLCWVHHRVCGSEGRGLGRAFVG